MHNTDLNAMQDFHKSTSVKTPPMLIFLKNVAIRQFLALAAWQSAWLLYWDLGSGLEGWGGECWNDGIDVWGMGV
jgi:hypothetical protein